MPWKYKFMSIGSLPIYYKQFETWFFENTKILRPNIRSLKLLLIAFKTFQQAA